MDKNEYLKHFDNRRAEFKPYGLTCEMWEPYLMKKFDRHNEIEINYLPKGRITYLFQNNQITIPEKRMTLFWGLIPHRIIDIQGNSPYYVCTIPLSRFLGWNMPSSLAEHILNCQIIIEKSEKYAIYDEFLLNNWFKDAINNGDLETTVLEMEARLRRLATNYTNDEKTRSTTHSTEVDLVAQITIYITRNYMNPIQIKDVANSVGLHPDYANMLFKKAFGKSIYRQIQSERIDHARRKLLSTDSSISEIAFECGFNSINRFNATFLQYTGCSPREFRKNTRTNIPEKSKSF